MLAPPTTTSRKYQNSRERMRPEVHAPAGSTTKLKAMLSEIVRLSIARSQDLALLSEGPAKEAFMACRFREEWRLQREDDLLRQLQPLRSEKDEELREHLRISIQTVVAKIGLGVQDMRGPSKHPKQLHRALQMDILLRQLESSIASPLQLCKDMVELPRRQIQQLLNGQVMEEMPMSSNNQDLERVSSDAQLRNHYENVAKVKEATATQASVGFSRILEAQRWAETQQANEKITAVASMAAVQARSIHDFEEEARRIAVWLVFRFRFRKSCRRFEASLYVEQLKPQNGSSAATKIQAAFRRHDAMNAFSYRWQLNQLQRRREERSLWSHRREMHRAMAPLVDELIEWNSMLTLEEERAEAAVTAEHRAFNVEWEVEHMLNSTIIS
ncbi:hypothetical protein AeRB84_001548 [Aphanomyces euteiches]|nr:hypothetical protein AeRB84_001548 [Aphanomyces euteiches]